MHAEDLLYRIESRQAPVRRICFTVEWGTHVRSIWSRSGADSLNIQTIPIQLTHAALI
jgi:hypothetical protein